MGTQDSPAADEEGRVSHEGILHFWRHKIRPQGCIRSRQRCPQVDAAASQGSSHKCSLQTQRLMDADERRDLGT